MPTLAQTFLDAFDYNTNVFSWFDFRHSNDFIRIAGDLKSRVRKAGDSIFDIERAVKIAAFEAYLHRINHPRGKVDKRNYVIKSEPQASFERKLDVAFKVAVKNRTFDVFKPLGLGETKVVHEFFYTDNRVFGSAVKSGFKRDWSSNNEVSRRVKICANNIAALKGEEARQDLVVKNQRNKSPRGGRR